MIQENEILYYLIAFILGYLVSRYMSNINGFIDAEPGTVTSKCRKAVQDVLDDTDCCSSVSDCDGNNPSCNIKCRDRAEIMSIECDGNNTKMETYLDSCWNKLHPPPRPSHPKCADAGVCCACTNWAGRDGCWTDDSEKICGDSKPVNPYKPPPCLSPNCWNWSGRSGCLEQDPQNPSESICQPK